MPVEIPKPLSEDELQVVRKTAYNTYEKRQKCGCPTCTQGLNEKTDWKVAESFVKNTQPGDTNNGNKNQVL